MASSASASAASRSSSAAAASSASAAASSAAARAPQVAASRRSASSCEAPGPRSRAAAGAGSALAGGSPAAHPCAHRPPPAALSLEISAVSASMAAWSCASRRIPSKLRRMSRYAAVVWGSAPGPPMGGPAAPPRLGDAGAESRPAAPGGSAGGDREGFGEAASGERSPGGGCSGGGSRVAPRIAAPSPAAPAWAAATASRGAYQPSGSSTRTVASGIAARKWLCPDSNGSCPRWTYVSREQATLCRGHHAPSAQSRSSEVWVCGAAAKAAPARREGRAARRGALRRAMPLLRVLASCCRQDGGVASHRPARRLWIGEAGGAGGALASGAGGAASAAEGSEGGSSRSSTSRNAERRRRAGGRNRDPGPDAPVASVASAAASVSDEGHCTAHMSRGDATDGGDVASSDPPPSPAARRASGQNKASATEV
mmetsp:Transcript_3157/g.13006  ORF Transcript_3157/g.13006 Transcript_3157/m.13006 type:complete len:428 (+) Transcript_3157:1063-2346(+)